MDNNEENNLDLLDLDDDTPVEALPETTPFAAPRPRKPWLLMGLAVVVIVLATYIIIRTVGNDSANIKEINLDTPEVIVGGDSVDVPVDTLKVPAKPAPVAPAPQPRPMPQPMPAPQPMAVPQPAPQPVVQPRQMPQPVVENNGVPVRVVADRRDVTFNPDKPAPAPKPVVEQPKPAVAAPVAKPAPKPAAKPAAKPVVSKPAGSWYVQFGSYGTRAAAETAERQMRAGHKSLFDGKQFVILAAQINGKTTYRLRVAFATSNDANGFCQNAKSDGLDCYVAK